MFHRLAILYRARTQSVCVLLLRPMLLLALLLTGCTGADAGGVPFVLKTASSYEGQLPCADCPGVSWKLDMWPDGRFHLRQEYLDRDLVHGRVGEWRYEQSPQRLILLSAGHETVFLSVAGPDELRMLDRAGDSIKSALNYVLRRQAVFDAGEFGVSLRGIRSSRSHATRKSGGQAIKTSRNRDIDK